MRTLISITIILTIVACNLRPTPKVMETVDLKYSAFYWHSNDQTQKREFYLYSYINIKKNGSYVLMGHDYWKGKTKYFAGIMDSSILKLIDTVFLKSKYKSDYSVDIENLVIYDGLTYCFDYTLEGDKNREVQFIPPHSPDQFKLLASKLDTLISKTIKSNIDTLLLETYKSRLSEISLLNLPPMPLPPPPIKKNEKKYKPSDYR